MRIVGGGLAGGVLDSVDDQKASKLRRRLIVQQVMVPERSRPELEEVVGGQRSFGQSMVLEKRAAARLYESVATKR